MSIDVHLSPTPLLLRLRARLNFYKIHLAAFTFIPLVFGTFFYAANGSASGNANSGDVGIQKVAFIDSLFCTYSAMTVTGLVTVNLSATHPFQQFLLFALMIMGDYSVVSLIVVLVRKRFFRQHCFELLRHDHFRRTNTVLERRPTLFDRVYSASARTLGGLGGSARGRGQGKGTGKGESEGGAGGSRKKMGKGIRGMISAPKDARPVDDFVEERARRPSQATLDRAHGSHSNGQAGDKYAVASDDDSHMSNNERDDDQHGQSAPRRPRPLRLSFRADVKADSPTSRPSHLSATSDAPESPLHGILAPDRMRLSPPPSPKTAPAPAHDRALNRERTIQITEPDALPNTPVSIRQRVRRQSRALSLVAELSARPSTAHENQQQKGHSLMHAPTMPLERSSTTHAVRHTVTHPHPYAGTPRLHHHLPHFPRYGTHEGFGGPPNPLQLLTSLLPSQTRDRIRRRMSHDEAPLTLLASTRRLFEKSEAELWDEGASWGKWWRTRSARWLPDGLGNLVVGRNSRFFTEELDDEELEQLGGVEYRALRLLSYLVAGYIFCFQVIPFAIIAIYFSQVNTWDPSFIAASGAQSGTVNKSWYSLFQVVAAYSGAGLSLVDESMTPFKTCYLLIYLLDIAMIAGNHALPMTLRLVIWIGTKIYPCTSETHKTLHFLLDHPRRCFLYLFPSHQTWYLLVAFVAFMAVELFSFLVLNIGLPVLDELSGWERFSDGLLQSLSVRAAGFGIVTVADLAPATQFIYIILMYVAIYPIAMSIRSTNVYEERSLGIYEHEHEFAEEPVFQGRRREVFSKYFAWHVRRQLAFDIWPLALAIWVICMLERGKLLDPARSAWFTVFAIIFECVSAYSTIGLSLGVPGQNYSFSADLGTASKLVVILVMLRGRHRGLPVAIDRAILLPQEYARIDRRRATDPSAQVGPHAVNDAGVPNGVGGNIIGEVGTGAACETGETCPGGSETVTGDSEGGKSAGPNDRTDANKRGHESVLRAWREGWDIGKGLESEPAGERHAA
ncbi:hypothetical protein Q5752_001119 [Cryptotrichosporon argae]